MQKSKSRIYKRVIKLVQKQQSLPAGERLTLDEIAAKCGLKSRQHVNYIVKSYADNGVSSLPLAEGKE